MKRRRRPNRGHWKGWPFYRPPKRLPSDLDREEIKRRRWERQHPERPAREKDQRRPIGR